MLKLEKKRAGKFAPVSLGGGAQIRLRRATQMDVSACVAQARRDVLSFAQPESGSLLAEIMPGFSVDALQDPATIDAAVEMLALMNLVMQCHDGWSGVGDDDGRVIEAPNREYVLLLLNDPAAFAEIDAHFKLPLYDEVREKKGSPALPNGEAGNPDIAANAEGLASDAPPASPPAGSIRA